MPILRVKREIKEISNRRARRTPYDRTVLRDLKRKLFNRMKNQYDENKLDMEAYFSNPATRNSAANVLWRFWRQRRHMSLPKVVKRFQDAKLMSTDIRQLRFDELVIFLRKKETIRLAMALLRSFHQRAQLVHEHEGTADRLPSGDGLVNVRVFLAVYMIVIFTSKVFESVGELENALIKSGRRLMANFELMIVQFTSRNHEFCKINANAVTSLLPSLFDYLRKFKEWKGPDEIKLTLRIEKALFCLHYSMEALPGGRDLECNARLVQEMITQTERLREKLLKIAGEQRLIDFDHKLVNGEGRGYLTMSTGEDYSVYLHLALDPKKYMSVIPKINNEQLAHELLLDPNFHLLPYDHADRENIFCNRVQEIYWEEISSDLQHQPPSYTRVFQCLKQIKSDFIDLSSGETQVAQIRNALDESHIEACIRANAFEWSEVIGLGSTMIVFVKRIQSPSRDESLRQKWMATRSLLEEATTTAERADAFSGMLRLILDNIGAIRIDKANARLRLISPVVREHGVDYENGKFNEKLRDGHMTIFKTKGYIQCAIMKAIEGGISLESLKEGSRIAFVKMLIEAFIHMVDNAQKPETFIPETLSFDVAKISALSLEFSNMALVSTALFASKMNFKKIYTPMAMASSSTQYANDAVSMTTEFVTGVEDKIKHFNHGNFEEILTKSLKSELDKTPLLVDQKEELIKGIIKVCKPDVPVFVLIKSRIVETWHVLFRKGVITTQDVAGLKYNACIISRIIKSCTLARRVFNNNLLVHGSRYNELIHEALSAM